VTGLRRNVARVITKNLHLNMTFNAVISTEGRNLCGREHNLIAEQQKDFSLRSKRQFGGMALVFQTASGST